MITATTFERPCSERKNYLYLKIEKIRLEIFIHRNPECIGVFFTVNAKLNTAVKKIPTIKWSRTYACWYLLFNKENYVAITKAIGSKAITDGVNIKNYLETKNKITEGKVHVNENTRPAKTILTPYR